jgi:hypothetical protein
VKQTLLQQPLEKGQMFKQTALQISTYSSRKDAFYSFPSHVYRFYVCQQLLFFHTLMQLKLRNTFPSSTLDPPKQARGEQKRLAITLPTGQ